MCQRIGVVRHSDAPRRYTSNTKNHVAIVVPGLSTGSSSSSTSASSTSFLQDVGEPTIRPAITRSQSGSRGTQGDLWRFRKTKNKNKHEDMLEGWKELSHDILRGCRISERILRKRITRHSGTQPQILLQNQKQQRRKKRDWENKTLILRSRRTRIARCAREPK